MSNNRYTTKYFVCKPQTCQLEAPTFNFLWSFLRIPSSATYAASVSVYLGVQIAHRRNFSGACACGVVELMSMNGIWNNEQHQRSNLHRNAVPRCCTPVLQHHARAVGLLLLANSFVRTQDFVNLGTNYCPRMGIASCIGVISLSALTALFVEGDNCSRDRERKHNSSSSSDIRVCNNSQCVYS